MGNERNGITETEPLSFGGKNIGETIDVMDGIEIDNLKAVSTKSVNNDGMVKENLKNDAEYKQFDFLSPDSAINSQNINPIKKEGIPKNSDFTKRCCIAEGVIIKGDIVADCPVEIYGEVNGNVETSSKLFVTGKIVGGSKADEIITESAELLGEVTCSKALEIGCNTVVIGNVSAEEAVIKGSIKGNLDIRGNVSLDSTAIILGDVKSKTIMIAKGAAMEGSCLQEYSEKDIRNCFNKYDSVDNTGQNTKSNNEGKNNHNNGNNNHNYNNRNNNNRNYNNNKNNNNNNQKPTQEENFENKENKVEN